MNAPPPDLARGSAAPRSRVRLRGAGEGRVVFADQLRGVAALSVALSHLIGVYWAMPGLAAAATATPLQERLPGGALPAAFALVADPRLQLGPLGVALFFLVSGFVIPLSLDVHARGGFLLARALRIYPTYVAAQLLQMAVLGLNARLWGTRFPYSAWDVAANCLLVENYLGVPSLDLVNWTLGVELKFYLLAALLAGPVRRGSVAALFAVVGGTLGLNAAIAGLASTPFGTGHAGLLTALSYDSLYVGFICIGTAFSHHRQGLVGTGTLLLCVPGLCALFLLCWRISRIAGQFPLVPANYLLALGLFSLLYAGRRHVPVLRPLRAMAAISYPFYLLHVLLGFSLLKLLCLRVGLGFEPALVLTLLLVGLAATALHLTVERASMRLARPLRRFGEGAAPASEGAHSIC